MEFSRPEAQSKKEDHSAGKSRIIEKMKRYLKIGAIAAIGLTGNQKEAGKQNELSNIKDVIKAKILWIETSTDAPSLIQVCLRW